MGNLDIELDSDLVEGLKRLAQRHYGDCGDASIGRVAEAAVAMRLLWLDLVKGGGNEIEEEPKLQWEVESLANNGGIYRILLKGGQDETGHHHSPG